MKIMFMFVAALSLASVGCKKKTAEKTAEGGDCAKALSHSMALSKAEMEKAPGMDAAMMQKLVDLGVQRCNEDKWSPDTIKCMIDAKTMTDAQGCYGKLTPEQQEKMNKAAMEMATQAGSAAGSGADGAGSAGSASDTGSAAGSDGAAAGSGAAAEGGSGSAAGSAAAPK